MSKLACLSALVAAVLIAGPAMAQQYKTWHDEKGTVVDGARVVLVSGRHCIRAPDEGAFATAPYRRPPCEPAFWY